MRGVPEKQLLDGDVEAYLALQQKKELLRFLTCGSVDDGKSTLIGRLLHDSNVVHDDQLDALRRDSAKRSSAGGAIDYSLLVDGLVSEREQGITIDVAYRYFATDRRKFIIADTPGHEQYTRNMATGASTADLAVILVDARLGVLPQTRRHSTIAALLGIRHVIVAVNKMDLRGYERSVFEAIRQEYQPFAEKLGFASIQYIPMSALQGDNVVAGSERMPWYEGPPLLAYLETVPFARSRDLEALRFPVQYVLRPDLGFRGFAGTIASGVVRPGATVVCLPSGRSTKVARVVTYDGDLAEAAAPLAVTLTLADEVDVGRGDTIVGAGEGRPRVARSIEADVVWMNEAPLRVGASYLLKHGTRMVSAEVSEIHDRVDVTTLERHPARSLGLNDIGRVSLTAARPLVFDAYAACHATGAFILVDRMTNGTDGAGMIRGPGAHEPGASATGEGVTAEERAKRLGQNAAVVVMTGPDHVRQEELARALERRLWDDGHTAHVLEGRDVAALGVCQRLGLISIVVAGVGQASADPSAAPGARDAERVVVPSPDASIEAIVEELRARGVFRS
ncbi:MAG TPA: sulfate adenylyltransferase subunit CysN [Polyangiaceae bacterium]